jgi:phosphotransferase system enzyme I (PtsI)
MSPAWVPSIKNLASHLRVEQAEHLLQQALKFPTTIQVKRFMADQIKKISPNVGILDTA